MERSFAMQSSAVHSDDVGVAFNASRPKAAASWGAIVAGAVVAVGISLIMFALGTGLGFASISPWQGHGVGVKGFTIAAVIWLIVMQWISSLFGGYIAGRLRTRWIGTHAHEIFFRDTAHGLVTWSLATLLVAALAASSVIAGIGGAVHAASDTSSSVVLDYGIDKLFRTVGGGRAVGGAAASGTSGGAAGAGTGTSSLVTSNPDTSIAASSAEIAEARGEVNRVMLRSVTNGVTPDNRGVTPDEGVTPDDRAYLVALVAARTGSTDSEAQRRVDNFLASVKQSVDSAKAAADAARRDAAEAATYTALALLIGAFIASVSAALGGRLRDEHV
jgi:hypothetical protein